MSFKKLLAFTAVIAASLTFTGCSAYSFDDLSSASPRFEESKRNLFSQREWVFIDDNDVRQPTQQCKDRAWYEDYCVETEGGAARLTWKEYKGRVRKTFSTITISGESKNSYCASIFNFTSNAVVCAVVPR